MYNRYVPQSDGSYQRNPVAEGPKQQNRGPQKPPPAPEPEHHHTHHPQQHPPHKPEPVGGFLKQLLPRNFDTADLIIVLLLLLLSGDCEEDRNTALLTLALYLFM